MTLTAIDHFAGTGWGVACHGLGIAEKGVEIMPEAIATRDVVGFDTIYHDVWDGLLDTTLVPDHDMLISSPPCPTFSIAGKGAGRQAMSDIHDLFDRGTWARVEDLHAAELGDPRTNLVMTPMAHAWIFQPQYIVLEQVPSVLPLWEQMAHHLERVGDYSVWTGKLNAEQYGVPQTRTRAILIARKDGKVAAPPRPTHSRFYPRNPERLDPGVKKWVSMAEALGWEPGGHLGFPRLDDGRGEPLTIGGKNYRSRDLRPTEQPAFVVGEKARSWNHYDSDGAAEPLSQADAATLQTYPQWIFERPSTTVAGDPRIAGPGRSEFVKGGVSRQDRPGSFKVTAEQLASVQSYPQAFPFQGSRTKQFLQIGNAVPPLLAEAILKEFL